MRRSSVRFRQAAPAKAQVRGCCALTNVAAPPRRVKPILSQRAVNRLGLCPFQDAGVRQRTHVTAVASDLLISNERVEINDGGCVTETGEDTRHFAVLSGSGSPLPRRVAGTTRHTRRGGSSSEVCCCKVGRRLPALLFTTIDLVEFGEFILGVRHRRGPRVVFATSSQIPPE
jgi:hypothetical protein